jgi:hypothetical protein
MSEEKSAESLGAKLKKLLFGRKCDISLVNGLHERNGDASVVDWDPTQRSLQIKRMRTAESKAELVEIRSRAKPHKSGRQAVGSKKVEYLADYLASPFMAQSAWISR